MEIGYHLSPGVWRGYGSIFLGISLHGNMNVVWIKILIYTRCFSQCLNTVSYALEEPDRVPSGTFLHPPNFLPSIIISLRRGSLLSPVCLQLESIGSKGSRSYFTFLKQDDTYS